MFHAHPTALVSMDAPTSARPADIAVDFGEFSSTLVTASAVSEAGRTWFADVFSLGAEAVKLPKSRFQAFADAAARAGLTVL